MSSTDPMDAQPRAARLIVVDDEREILDVMGELFEGADLELVCCATGAEALVAMRAGGVDVLLTDKNLPDIGGLDLIERAREITPDVMAIVFTGFASVDTAVVALQRGAVDYIVKPPRSIFDVRRKVEAAIERQALARENVRLVARLRAKNEALQSALETVKRVQDELVQSEKLAGIGTLAAGIAHEIGSPLFGVMGLAEAIGDEAELPQIHDHAREIVRYCQHIKEIVLGLGNYSRRAAADDDAPVDVADTVRAAVRLVIRSTGRADDAVVIDADEGLQVLGRTSELQQIVVNLTKNALEAADAQPGDVCVRAKRESAHIVLSVGDRGPGVPEAVRREIFDPFFTTKAPGQGTGLGLNIVYRLVMRYHGSIGIDDREGGGALFTVRLPASA